MIGNLSKEDILNKLQSDKTAFEFISGRLFASDLKIKLDSKLEYVEQLLEYIKQEGKV